MKSLSQWIQRSIPKIACAFFGLLLLCSQLTVAQSTNSGDIRGTVTDTTAAVLPGATVTVLNDDTGVSNEFSTDGGGIYDTSSIVPGHYTITFKKDGFETFVRGPVTVIVGYMAVNAELKVGAATTQVTVTTDVPLLNTEGGDLTVTLEADTLDQLPQVGSSNNSGNSWENFTQLLPGSAGNATKHTGAGAGQVPSVNGSLPFNNILMDGASTALPASGNANAMVFDDIAEVQFSLSTFSAQYGEGGYLVNQITKGGTDKFHGSAYEYANNSFLNAANFGFGNEVAVGRVRYNNFGGTIGGPIAIPLFKKKAFFFFNYDQIVNSAFSSGYDTVPTSAILAGDFTGGYTLYDPTTQTIGTDANGNPYPIRQTFASECANGTYSGCTGNEIPSSLIDKVSAAFEKFYPTAKNSAGQFLQANQQSPNLQPNGVYNNNWYSAFTEPRPWRRYFGRLDYDITPNNRLTISDNQGDQLQPNYGAVTDCPIACQSNDIDNNNAEITDVWNISPRTINEARMGYTDQLNQANDASLGLGIPAQLGWQFAKVNDLPAVAVGPYFEIQPAGTSIGKEFVFDPSDVVTMIRGKHILHVGGEFTAYRDDGIPGGAFNAGALSFGGVYTENWTVDPSTGIASPNTSSGEAFADFLLGYAQGWNANVTPESGARLKKPQMFAQDDWKLRRNLTVNLGLRYEISHGFNEVKGNEDTFDPTVKNDDGTLGAFWYGTTHANGRTSLQANVFDTFLPRLGFSWQPIPATVVRGGFGLYSNNFSGDNGGTSGLGGTNASSGSYSDSSNGIYPVTKFSGTGTLFPLGGGTVAPLPFTKAGTDPGRFNGQGVSYNDYHTPIGKNMQWNLTLERAFRTDYVVSVGYVGSHGYNLAFPTNLNAVPESELSSNDYQYRAYPNFQSISGNTWGAISNYNSMQASITKRMTHGFSMSFNYVWSHMLDDQDSSGWGGKAGDQVYQHATTLALNQDALNYGPSDFDQRQAFKGYVVYQLPFGIGKQFMNTNRIADEVLGGWQITGMVLELSGGPFQPASPGSLYTEAGTQFPNREPGVSITPSGGKSWQHWFNEAAFSQPAAGAFGNVQRNPLVGPGINEFNLSGGKEFSIGENVKFQLRCDAANAFNHPSFGATGNSSNFGLAGGGPGLPFTANAVLNQLAVGGRTVQLSGHITF